MSEGTPRQESETTTGVLLSHRITLLGGKVLLARSLQFVKDQATANLPQRRARERRHSNQQHAETPRSALRAGGLSLPSAVQPLQAKRAQPNRLASGSTRRDDLLSAFPYRSTFRRRSLSSASLDEERHRNDKGSAETGSAPWARWLKWTGRAWLFRCNILARQPTPRRNALGELSHPSKGELEQARVGAAEGPASRCWPAWRLISRISAWRGGIAPSFGSLQFSSPSHNFSPTFSGRGTILFGLPEPD